MPKTPTTQKEENIITILEGTDPINPPEKEELVYSKEEKKYWEMLVKKINYARDEREQNHPELDGMTYTQYYESNRKKDLSYIPPKQNKTDIRIVTGTTREKTGTLLSTLLNLDLSPVVSAFDEDNVFVSNLGLHTADLVTKSREIEEYWKKKSTIYREFLAQGDVFLEEYYNEEYTPVPVENTYASWDPRKSSIKDFKPTKFKLKKTKDCPEIRMIKGTKVYLGSTKIENIQDQDIVAVLNVYSRDTAEAKYGTWDRWKHVPDTANTVIVADDEGVLYKDWNVTKVPQGQVGELRIYLPKRNRFMIMLNGVMMLPIDYPMQAVAPSGRLPIIQGKNEPISNFAYSKSVPSKTKVDQEVLDEVIKLFMTKLRQSATPSMGHTGSTILNPNVLYPAKITPKMSENALFPILPPEARMLTNSDFSFYKMIKENIEEKTVNAVYSGQSPEGNTTATEVLQQKQQQMLKLGLTLDGIVAMEKDMVWHRIYTIYAHWTKPVDTKVDTSRDAIKAIYRSLTLETTLENEDKGYKVFRFGTEYPDEYEQAKEEEKLGKTYGKSTRIVYMNPEELKTLKYMFFVSIIPSDKAQSELAKVIFVQNVREAYELFGPESMHVDHIKQRYAIKIGENYEKWFKPQDQMQMMNNMISDVDQASGKKGTSKAPVKTPTKGYASQKGVTETTPPMNIS